MALTKSYTESVLNRIRTDKAYAEALYNEAIEAIMSGEREEGLASHVVAARQSVRRRVWPYCQGASGFAGI